jgi:hypothetical protein
MFTAVGASAFIVRVRSAPPRPRCTASRPVTTAYEQLPGATAMAKQRVLDAASRGDRFRALVIFRDQLLTTPLEASIVALRDELERTHLESELLRISADVDAGQCAEARQRLEFLRDLLPHVEVNAPLGDCEP